MKTIWQIKNVTAKRVQLLGAAYDDATKELERIGDQMLSTYELPPLDLIA